MTKGDVARMEETQVYERLTEIVRDVFDDDSIIISADTKAKDVDGWDSLSHIRLIVTIEKVFGMKFSTSEIGRLEKVSDLVALIIGRC